jgi:hypothetical protein
MNHRSIIKGAIIFVIAIVIVWSVVNISEYAAHYHASIVVWSLGLALGLANALSVYAVVISSSNRSRVPAGIGIGLFGGMSAILQWLLYLTAGAPMLAAIAFGCFGPVAEAVLSWLHAALSEDEAKAKADQAERLKAEADRKAAREAAKNRNANPQKTADPQLRQAAEPQPQLAATPELRIVQQAATDPAILERRRQIAALRTQGHKQQDIADRLRISLRTVQEDVAQMKKTATIPTNGASH